MLQPELIADYQCQIGENPLWHPLGHRLYWTDIPRGRLFRYYASAYPLRPPFSPRPQ